tara:strand:- start:467 stop:637 length:171 start_codon:yes stop_codon:yes gene_type:complete
MTSFRSRPKFQHQTEKKAKEINKLFKQALLSTKNEIIRQVFDNHLILRINKNEQHV